MEPVSPLLTDRYQLTMGYSYWKSNIHNSESVFEMFFRKNPFNGNFTIFGGLSESLELVQKFKFTEDELSFVKNDLNIDDDGYIDCLRNLDMKKVTITAMAEGGLIYPKCPVMILKGPLLAVQLLETPLLNLCGFSSLVATYANRMRQLLPNKALIEFGARRAQGPNGALTASKYSYIGGFDGTSNMQAGKLFGIKTVGTHAHSYVTSFTDLNQVSNMELKGTNLLNAVQIIREKYNPNTNNAELAAFIAYAYSYPDAFLVLIDTYNTLNSGVWNFLYVAAVLYSLGYQPKGVRIDSGDLSEISKKVKQTFVKFGQDFSNDFEFKNLIIVASDGISENTIRDLEVRGHAIDVFGIGTNLVTCKDQPALGMVFKLVEINGVPKMKMSENIGKATLPGKKKVLKLHVSEFENNKNTHEIILLALDYEDYNSYKSFDAYSTADNKCTKFSVLCGTNVHNVVWDKNTLNIPSVEISKNENSKINTKNALNVYITKDLHSLTNKLYQSINNMSKGEDLLESV